MLKKSCYEIGIQIGTHPVNCIFRLFQVQPVRSPQAQGNNNEGICSGCLRVSYRVEPGLYLSHFRRFSDRYQQVEGGLNEKSRGL